MRKAVKGPEWRAVREIERDLRDRRGLKYVWEDIDNDNPEILREIRSVWRKIIADSFRSAGKH